MRDCDKCGGTGKLRSVAVVGAPSQQDVAGARARFADAVHAGDYVVCGSDHAQMLCADLGIAHVRERGLSDAEIVARADASVDLASKPEPVAPPSRPPAPIAAKVRVVEPEPSPPPKETPPPSRGRSSK